jgi:hypothetical protein
MKTHFFIALLCAIAVAARAQSTAITYQGRLAEHGLPYNGLAEMQCLLYSTSSGGAPFASNTPAVSSVNVSNGLFTVPLDFGAGAFPGAPRFLEIQVRTNLGAFFTMTPRQALTPAPSALFSLGPWVSSGNDLSYTSGKVGIGTTNPGSAVPSAKLDVVGGDVVVANGSGFFSRNAAGIGIGAGIGSKPNANQDDLRLFAGGQQRVRITSGGRVGIGLFDELGGPIAGVHIKNDTDPSFGTLAVQGDPFAPLGAAQAFLTIIPQNTVSARRAGFGYLSPGTSDLTIANAGGGHIVLSDVGGTHLPTCGEESLRIVRGTVRENLPDIGTGFTVTNGDFPGDYIITFSAPFSATPSVTATALAYGAIRYAQVGEVDATHVLIATHDGTIERPTSFSFIAIGPR